METRPLLLDTEKEFTRRLSMALFPEGCGIDPTDLELVLPKCGDGRVVVKVEGYLEPSVMKRVSRMLETASAPKEVTQNGN